MAEEFQAGICGGNWWNPSKSIFMGCSSPYSTGISDMASFGWAADMVDIKPKSNCEESNNFQNDHQQKPDQQQQQQADSDSGGSSILIDSTLQMMGFGLSSLSTSEWNQSLLRSNGGTNQTYNSFLQEDINSRLGNCRQETVMDSSQIPKEWSPKSYTTSPGEDSSITTFKPINQDFSLNSITSTPTCQGLTGYPSPTLIQTLFESDLQPQPSLFNNRPINYMSGEATYGGANSNEPSSPPWPKLAPFARPPKQQQQQQQPGSLHFTNNTAFWNASASSGGINNVKAGLLPSVPQSQYLAQTFEDKPNCPSLTKTKANSEELRDSGSVVKKGSSDQPPFKRPRIETPSPLPTFKVRKEKLGDRITALQQLVSPFGKTDTASVLHEAIEYIKLLHDQVNVLSTPYMKQAATPIQQQSCDKLKEATEGPKQDLRSRGLCLVPISSTFPVANETMADFWTPTFGGTFR